MFALLLLLLCSFSRDDVPPESQRNVSMAAVWGAVCPSICVCNEECSRLDILAGDQSWPFFTTLLYLVTETLCLVILRV